MSSCPIAFRLSHCEYLERFVRQFPCRRGVYVDGAGWRSHFGSTARRSGSEFGELSGFAHVAGPGDSPANGSSLKGNLCTSDEYLVRSEIISHVGLGAKNQITCHPRNEKSNHISLRVPRASFTSVLLILRACRICDMKRFHFTRIRRACRSPHMSRSPFQFTFHLRIVIPRKDRSRSHVTPTTSKVQNISLSSSDTALDSE
jgi:hypothetical protein